MSTSPPDFAAVVAEVSACIASLRQALNGALRCVLPELNGGRACGRALGLKRDLGWKVYAIASSTDAPTVLRLLPRRTGWKLVLKGLRDAKCPPDRLSALTAAIDAVVARLDAADVDRALLRAVAAGGLDSARESLAMVRGRAAARRANEEIYGVRAASVIGTYVVGAPDARQRVDLFGTAHFEGLRRLRPGRAVPVHVSLQAWQPDWKGVRAGRGVGGGSAVPSLVDDLSDVEVGRGLLRAVGMSDGTVIEYLGDGSESPRGHRAVFADYLRHGGFVGQSDDRAEVNLFIDLPVAYALFEVWMHRSICRLSEPAAALIGSFGRVPALGEEIDLMRLPLETTAEPIASQALPRAFSSGRRVHHEMLRRATTMLKRPAAEFDGFRVVVSDPPIGSRIVLKWRM